MFVLKVVTFSVIVGMTAVIVGDEVGAAVGLLTVITVETLTVMDAVLAFLKDVDNSLMEVRNDPVGPIAFVKPAFRVE
jgi:hypothetical protein